MKLCGSQFVALKMAAMENENSGANAIAKERESIGTALADMAHAVDLDHLFDERVPEHKNRDKRFWAFRATQETDVVENVCAFVC